MKKDSKGVHEPEKSGNGESEVIRLQSIMLELAKSDNISFDIDVQKILETIARSIKVNRVSLWLFDEKQIQLKCHDLYNLTNDSHESGIVLNVSDFPIYFHEINQNRLISVYDAYKDLKTREFAKGYLKPLGVVSMLDVPVWAKGRLIGILCNEHIGARRKWSKAEEDLTATASELVALAYIADQRLQYEQELVRSNEKYKNLYRLVRLMSDNMPDLLWAKDMEKKYIFANKAHCDKLLKAKDTDEPTGKTDMFFALRERALHPDDPEWHTFGEICANSDDVVMVAKENSCRFDEYGNVGNSFLYLDVRKAPILDENGTMIGIVGSARDITKEKEMEQKLIESEKKYRTLFEMNLSGIYQSTLEGKVIACNTSLARMMGYESVEEGFRMDVYSFYLNQQDRVALMHKLKNEGAVVNYELKLRKKDGTAIWVLLNAQISEDHLINGSLIDISQVKEYQLRLEESEKKLSEANYTKDKFFSIIAHDLKSPFNAIMGFSNLLYENYEDYKEEERIDFLRSIKNASENTYKLVENLLEWSRAQSGKIQPLPEVFDISLLTNQVILSMRPNAEAKKIKLLSAVKYYTFVLADPNLINTVLRNLVSNAIKFTGEKGQVYITAIAGPDSVTVMVVDNGKGIRAKDQEKLFRIDLKFKTDGTANESGTGLGLILCKEFIEINGGRIWVESEPGKGSRFIFTLPKPDSR